MRQRHDQQRRAAHAGSASASGRARRRCVAAQNRSRSSGVSSTRNAQPWLKPGRRRADRVLEQPLAHAPPAPAGRGRSRAPCAGGGRPRRTPRPHQPAGRRRRSAPGVPRLAAVPKLQLLPAVDVADGQAVRLVQGEAGSETSYGDPLEAALAWQRDGAEWVHLVDLDAAFGRGSNRELLARGGRRARRRRRALRRHPGRRVAGRRAGHRLPAGQPRARRRSSRPSGAPGRSPSTATGSPSASTSAAPGWPPAAGPGGRRALRDPRPARRRGLRPLRRHRHHQGRHAARAQPRPAARGLRAPPTGR